MNPLPLSILAIDPGSNSGWASFRHSPDETRDPGWPIPRWYVNAGSCDPFSNMARNAMGRFCPEDTLDALVMEHPGSGGTGRFMSMAVGLGEAMGAWRRMWRDSCRFQSHELDVVQVSWRAGMFPGSSGLATHEWKALAKNELKAMIEESEPTGCPWSFATYEDQPIDQEIADACLLGWWALHSPALADTVGPKKLARLGWEDREECLRAQAQNGKVADGHE